jgi:hypothetical protein
MALTPAQLTTLKAAINANPTWAAFPMTSDGAYDLAALLNATANPAYVVWKTSVTQDEIMQNGFDWVRVDNLSVGKARIWEWLFDNQTASINPSKLNVRSGIDECWKGTAADLAVRAAVYVHCKRNATEFEKILATGAGTDAAPSTMAAPGPVSYQDVEAARNS